MSSSAGQPPMQRTPCSRRRSYGFSYRDIEELLAERGIAVDHVTVYRWVQRFTPLFAAAARPLRHAAGDRWFFTRALRYGPAPAEVTTDKAAPYLRVLDELIPAALHVTEQYRNNRIKADHGQLKARLRPMRGLKRFRPAARIAAGHAFVQNLRRGHYELATDVASPLRLATAFTELARAV